MYKLFRCSPRLIVEEVSSGRYFDAGALQDFDNLLVLGREEIFERCQHCCKAQALGSMTPGTLPTGLLPPLGAGHRVHAAGVTYLSSKLERQRESAHAADAYARVYLADRPELFFKADPEQVVGPEGQIRIREDSTWDVSEPELAVAFNPSGEILGYTICNDLSSRSIEGENPLYLPQAKMWDECCALGPGLLILEPKRELETSTLVKLEVFRQGQLSFSGETSVGQMKRSPSELVQWLLRDRRRMFSRGGILSTGTGIIPSPDFTHQPGDVVSITIEPIGTLRNTVIRGYAF